MGFKHNPLEGVSLGFFKYGCKNSEFINANASSELNVRKLLKNNVVNEKEGILN